MKLLHIFPRILKIFADLTLLTYYSYNICNKNDM